jgi:hypothetical protein
MSTSWTEDAGESWDGVVGYEAPGDVGDEFDDVEWAAAVAAAAAAAAVVVAVVAAAASSKAALALALARLLLASSAWTCSKSFGGAKLQLPWVMWYLSPFACL